MEQNVRGTNVELCAEKHKQIDKEIARQNDMNEKLAQIAKEHQIVNAQLTEMLKNHETKLVEHDRRIDELRLRPAIQWQSMITTIMSALTTGAIAWLVFQR